MTASGSQETHITNVWGHCSEDNYQHRHRRYIAGINWTPLFLMSGLSNYPLASLK